MLAFLCLLVTLLCLVQPGVSLSNSKAHHRKMTNAQRFARGLPPAPPKRFFGSRSESARRSSVSAIPGQAVSGTVQFTSGGITYYLAADGAVTTLAGGAGGAILVQYVDPASPTTPVSLEELVDGTPMNIYFAFGGGIDSTDLDSSTNNFVQIMGATGSTSVGDQPTQEPVESGGSSYLETSIFIIDPTTGDITLTWVNSGGDTVTDIVLSTDGSLLYMGSGSAYLMPNSFSLVDSITFLQSV